MISYFILADTVSLLVLGVIVSLSDAAALAFLTVRALRTSESSLLSFLTCQYASLKAPAKGKVLPVMVSLRDWGHSETPQTLTGPLMPSGPS